MEYFFQRCIHTVQILTDMHSAITDPYFAQSMFGSYFHQHLILVCNRSKEPGLSGTGTQPPEGGSCPSVLTSHSSQLLGAGRKPDHTHRRRRLRRPGRYAYKYIIYTCSF